MEYNVENVKRGSAIRITVTNISDLVGRLQLKVSALHKKMRPKIKKREHFCNHPSQMKFKEIILLKNLFYNFDKNLLIPKYLYSFLAYIQ